MYCSIILWNLRASTQTVASLRAYLRDHAVEAYGNVEGLVQKVWISADGEDGELWGGVYLWTTWEAAYGRTPLVSTIRDLIGYRPSRRLYFSVEAGTAGPAALQALGAGVGLAFTDPAAPPLRAPDEVIPPGWDPRSPRPGGRPG